MNLNVFKSSFGKKLLCPGLLCMGVLLGATSLALADEPGPGVVYPPQKRAVRPLPPPAPEAARQEHNAAAVMEPDCDWGYRVAGGVPYWMFDKENNQSGAGVYADAFNNGRRINLRAGIEGRHMYLGQDPARSAQEFEGKTTRITYMRIPLSVEYIVPLDEDRTQFFFGGGPDIVHTANDIESTTVGAHLSARLLYNFDPNWGVAIEGGYMWGNAKRTGKDVNLDGAYVTPTLNYTF